jgi:hypothetical protein
MPSAACVHNLSNLMGEPILLKGCRLPLGAMADHVASYPVAAVWSDVRLEPNASRYVFPWECSPVVRPRTSRDLAIFNATSAAICMTGTLSLWVNTNNWLMTVVWLQLHG